MRQSLLKPPPPSLPVKPRTGGDPGPADCRCLCGSLLARRVACGVELKCRRCKRTLVVPFDSEEAM